MSHGAQVLYVALKRRLNHYNNGSVYLSQRIAAKELSSHHNQIARWFRELQYFGFIVMTQGACLGVEGRGKAPRWRLTEWWVLDKAPTRDFDRWDGTPFVDKKISRAGKHARSVREMRHTSVQENLAASSSSVRESPHKWTNGQCAGNPSQNYVATPTETTVSSLKTSERQFIAEPNSRTSLLKSETNAVASAAQIRCDEND